MKYKVGIKIIVSGSTDVVESVEAKSEEEAIEKANKMIDNNCDYYGNIVSSIEQSNYIPYIIKENK